MCFMIKLRTDIQIKQICLAKYDSSLNSDMDSMGQVPAMIFAAL